MEDYLEIGYKAVSVWYLGGERKYRSIVASKMVGVPYKIGEITKPSIPETPLFVFDTLDRAEDFAHRGTDPQATVLKVNYKLFKFDTIRILMFPSSRASVEAFWYLKGYDKVYYSDTRSVRPYGTVFAEYVIPLEEIDYGD